MLMAQFIFGGGRCKLKAKRFVKTKQDKSFKGMARSLLSKGERALYLAPMIHINVGGEVQVDNAKAVLAFDEQGITIDLGCQSVNIAGINLVLSTFEKNQITLHGNITAINFSYK